MASSIIHIAVAKEVAKKIKIKRKKDYYLGAIAPDISKQIGETKYKSHFLKNSYMTDTPNIELFIRKYHDFKNNSFDLGYFTHLYTDKMWEDNFIKNITDNNTIKLLDGTVLRTSPEEVCAIIYSDYTNLNTMLIDEYELDLSLFYEEFEKPKTSIREIPVEKLDILINKIGIIIENSKGEKTYSINKDMITEFIDNTTKFILDGNNNR